MMKRYTLTFLIILFPLCQVMAQDYSTWYQQANERIDSIRKGSFDLMIFDKNGNPYHGDVKIELKKHDFEWGIAFDFYEGEIQTEIPTETQWRKAAMYKYFNYGVSGNSFKWSGIQAQQNNLTYEAFENALNWAENVGWELRAHTLLWGGTTYEDDHPTPRWVKDLPTPEAMLDACEERIKRELTRYKGRVFEYDVINEPVHATYLQSLVGDSMNWKCFQWAKEADPDAKLFVNEYNVEFGWGDLDEYHALIQQIIDNGGPLSGIGIQAHFWDCCRPNINDIVHAVETLSEFNVPIKFTEFDYGGNLSEAEQAADFIKVATIAFSHPSMNGMVSWALSDNGAWRENTGYFREDLTPKLAADTLLYYTQQLWSTRLDTTMSELGALQFDAFYGDYEIEVNFGDTVKVFTIQLLKENEGQEVVLYEDNVMIKGPELLQANLITFNRIELVYDLPVDPESINKYNFRLFKDAGIAISEAYSKEDNDSIIVLDFNTDVFPSDYITISYFPGTLKGSNGGIAPAYGITEVQYDATSNEPPFIQSQSFRIAASARGGTFIGAVQASDPEGMPLRYRIIGGSHPSIAINELTGGVVLTNPFLLDPENMPKISLTIEVNDGFHTASAEVNIMVDEVLALEFPFELHVFPNPAKDYIHIKAEQDIESIYVYDLNGRAIHSIASHGNMQDISINIKAPGTYILETVIQGYVKRETILVVE